MRPDAMSFATRRPSCAGRAERYEHKHADVIEAAVKRAIKKVIGEATDSHVKAVKAALADASAKMAAGGP